MADAGVSVPDAAHNLPRRRLAQSAMTGAAGMVTDGAAVAAKDADVVAGAMALRQFSRAQMQSRRLSRWRGRDRIDAEMVEAVAVAEIAVVAGSSLRAMACRRAMPPHRPLHRAQHLRHPERRGLIHHDQIAKDGSGRTSWIEVDLVHENTLFHEHDWRIQHRVSRP